MKTISFVIPIYNEASRIGECLRALKTYAMPKGLKLEKVIFVDDGSTDSTLSIISRSKKSIETKLSTRLEVISYTPNHGKGYAVKTGMAASESDYTLFLDADMATPLSELSKFIPAMNKGIQVIVGTRKNGHSTVVVHQPKYRELMGKVFTYSSNVILNTWVTDFTCGFKAFSRDAKNHVFPRLMSDRWGFDAESIFVARRAGYSIVEVPVVWTDKKGSKVNVLIDAPRSFIDLFKMRVFHATKDNTSIGAKYLFSRI